MFNQYQARCATSKDNIVLTVRAKNEEDAKKHILSSFNVNRVLDIWIKGTRFDNQLLKGPITKEKKRHSKVKLIH